MRSHVALLRYEKDQSYYSSLLLITINKNYYKKEEFSAIENSYQCTFLNFTSVQNHIKIKKHMRLTVSDINLTVIDLLSTQTYSNVVMFGFRYRFTLDHGPRSTWLWTTSECGTLGPRIGQGSTWDSSSISGSLLTQTHGEMNTQFLETLFFVAGPVVATLGRSEINLAKTYNSYFVTIG